MRGYLEGKSPGAVALYRRFAELVRRCGPVAIVPGPDGIAFQVGGTFAAIDRLTARGLHAHVVLHRRLEHPRFSRVDVSSPNHQVHYFRATQVSDLNEDVAAWLAEGYRDAALHS